MLKLNEIEQSIAYQYFCSTTKSTLPTFLIHKLYCIKIFLNDLVHEKNYCNLGILYVKYISVNLNDLC